MFSHTIKAQESNMSLLDAVLQKVNIVCIALNLKTKIK